MARSLFYAAAFCLLALTAADYLQEERACDASSRHCDDATSTHLLQKAALRLSSGGSKETGLSQERYEAACGDGWLLRAVQACPAEADLPACSLVPAGQICEGDGECGTRNDLNNCGPWDVYLKLKQKASLAVRERAAKPPKDREKPEGTTRYAMTRATPDLSSYQEILARNGYFLGFSRDCWIVIGIMVGAALFSFLVVYGSVYHDISWRAKWVGLDIPYEEDQKTIAEPGFPVGFLQRVVFRADLNSAFAYRADLATRSALACAVCALTYWVPSLEFMNDFGWSMQYVVVIICFTVYMDMGQTVSLAWANFYGTLLPTLNVIVIYGFYAKGVFLESGEEEGSTLFTPAWWTGMVDFVLFCGAFLVLNVPVGVRMFALSWQAYFSMAYMTPTDDTKFSRGLNDIVLQGAAIGPLVGTIIGCVISILVPVSSPLGFTFSGLGQAQQSAVELAWKFGQEWTKTVDYYSGTERTLEIDKVIGEANLVRQQISQLGDQLSCTWWECFDLGRTGRVKAHLTELRSTFDVLQDWFRGVVLAMQDEDFCEAHAKVMAKVRAPLARLCDATNQLLYRAAQGAVSGYSPSACTDPESTAYAEALRMDAAAVMACQRELAAAFAAARYETYGKDELTADAIGEHFICFSFSTISKNVREYAEYLLEDKVANRTIVDPLTASVNGFLDTLSFNSTGFICRSALGFFSAWVIGYFGIAQVMARHSSTAAGTTAYLMAAEGKGGSALLKNVARFQGTAGGTIIGQLVYETVIVCTVGSAIVGFGVVLVFEFFAFYLYFSSQSYGYVGLLFAAYGAMHLILDCETSANTSKSVYNTIIDQTMAIICITVADLIVQNHSSAHLAADWYSKMARALVQALSTLFSVDPMVTTKGFGMCEALGDTLLDGAARFMDLGRMIKTRISHTDVVVHQNLSCRTDLLESYVKAMDMGGEAPLEPRLVRLPFKERLWTGVMSSMNHMATQTIIMEYAINSMSQEGADASRALKALASCTVLKRRVTNIIKRGHMMFHVAHVLLRRETLAPLGVDKDLIKRMNKVDFLTLDDVMEEIAKEINAVLPASSSAGKCVSLAHEDFCLVAVVLMMTKAIAENINSVEKLCFMEPDIRLEED